MAAPVEVCETRVLLSATSADPTEGVSAPSDISGSTDFYSVAVEGPLGDEVSDLDSAYSDYENSYQEMLGDAYEQTTSTQKDYSSEQPQQDGGSSSDDSNSDSNSDNSAADDAAATEESFSGGLEGILSQLLVGSDEAGSESDDDSNTDDQVPADPFEIPQHVSFTEFSLPVESDYTDLFSVAPDGSESFVQSSSSETTSVALDENGNEIAGVAPTDIVQDITLEQTLNNDGSWVVHQSVTDTFREQQTATDVPVEDQSAARTGTKTYSVTVIDGTTTVRTYTQTDTRLLDNRPASEDGGASPLSADSRADYVVPASWIDGATGESADQTNSDSDGSGDSGDTGNPATEWGSDDSPGDTTFSNTGLTTTVTDTQITLDDGTAAIQTTTSLSWYVSFSYKDSGSFDGDETEDADSDDDSASDDDLPESFNAEITGGYKVFASASAGGHFTSTTVTPVGGTEAIEDLSSTSFGFAISVMAGGGLELTTHFTQDEKSGSEADETDTYDFFDLKDTIEYSGSTGFSFYVAASTGEEADETTGDTVSSESEDDEPAVGEQTAQELLAGKSNGMQVSFSVNGSSSYDSNHTIENKNRWGDSASEDGSHGFEEMSSSKVSSGGSGGNAIVQLGTDAMLVSVGASGGSSNTENSNFTTYDLSVTAGDTAMMSTDAGFSETSSFDYEWGLTIGGETGFELIDEGSYDVNVSITEEGITSFNGYLTGFALEEIYIDYSEDEEEGDPEQTGGSQEERPERVHRLTHTHINGADRTDEIIFENAPVGAVPTDPNADQEEESADDLLNSYQAQMEQLYRLQALLAQTDDPEDRAWLEGLIAAQEDAVANAAEAAAAAGVTADQLATAAEAAQDAIDADPPTWTSPGDLGDDDIDSGAPGYWHFLLNPSDMDSDLHDGFFLSLGVAGGALGLAGGLAAAPFIAAFAGSASTFTIPTLGTIVTPSGTMMLGITGGTTVTVTGSQAMTAAGMMSAALFSYRSSGGFEKMGNGDNTSANRDFKHIVNQLKLNKSQQRQLHDEITGMGYSLQEILAIAKSLFGN